MERRLSDRVAGGSVDSATLRPGESYGDVRGNWLSAASSSRSARIRSPPRRVPKVEQIGPRSDEGDEADMLLRRLFMQRL